MTQERVRPPSIADVARFAGVSHQTVSRVLNDHPSVRELTRARVLAAIEQLGYRPNTAARALASGRSKTLGVVALDSTLYGPASTLYGIERAARRAGYFVSVVSLSAIDRQSVAEAVRQLTDQAVEGLAVIAPFISAHDALDRLYTDMPVVAVEGDPEGEVPVVRVDQVTGARLATEHLLASGRGTVFHIAGPGEWQEARDRTAGWRAVLEETGADITAPLPGDWSARSGYEAGQVLAQVPDARAIFAANDHMALGLLRALYERGRRVPEDVAVVGFDDTPESAYFIPPLTTVRQDFRSVGRAVVTLLLERLSTGRRSHDRVIIEPTLVCRESSLVPAAHLERPSLASGGVHDGLAPRVATS
ncbi:MAG TPA: LacI family DNA-binding transcriptional regulator [Acidimicrobiales bacterium]|nr:LacI family DNA-binding transcriptional regulator [Acidimicrobiales bacterium]